MSEDDEAADGEPLFSRFGVITTAGNRDLERRAQRLREEREDDEGA